MRRTGKTRSEARRRAIAGLRHSALGVALALFSLAAADPAAAATKTVVGRLEQAWIAEAKLTVRAKLDTGAHTTSLDAEEMRVFQRGGADWVRFRISDDAGRSAVIQRRVVRFARLKKNGSGVETRPVITLGICVADIYRVTQVNLVPRTGLAFRMLIGRRFLFGRAVVDVARKYTSEPRCSAMRGN